MYLPKKLEPRTLGKDGFSWPTPRAQSARGSGPSRTGNRMDLQTAAKLWPTPQAHDAQKGYAKRVGRFGTKHGGRNLADEVLIWPTPGAGGSKGSGPKGLGGGTEAKAMASGQLNPQFCEWLMGYPLEWTVLKDWAIPVCLPKRAKRSKDSSELEATNGHQSKP